MSKINYARDTVKISSGDGKPTGHGKTYTFKI